MIEQIGPDLDNGNADTIYVAIPSWFRSFTDIEIWVHEFVEHTLGKIILQEYIPKRVIFGDMKYAVQPKHFLTCLSTFSGADNGKEYWHITPEDYIEIVKLSELSVEY